MNPSDLRFEIYDPNYICLFELCRPSLELSQIKKPAGFAAGKNWVRR